MCARRRSSSKCRHTVQASPGELHRIALRGFKADLRAHFSAAEIAEPAMRIGQYLALGRLLVIAGAHKAEIYARIRAVARARKSGQTRRVLARHKRHYYRQREGLATAAAVGSRRAASSLFSSALPSSPVANFGRGAL